MKYERLRITNYRGVDSSEIEFESRGVTLVQGPNEAGKTSLGEAIGVLFEYPDSSKHSIVKAIRPVHRDVGSEIELVAESGPYKFTYFKRYHKKPETRLTITAPAPENHTGREAHDRAKAILGETLDIDLWKALTIQQGDAIAQPDLANQQSLSAALDKAAGGVPADQIEEGLFDKVEEQYRRFYTATGREKTDLTQADEQHEQAKSTVADITKQFRNLDQDIDSAGRLQTELTQLTDREVELTQEIAKQAEALRQITSLENQVSKARLKLESTAKTEEMVKRDRSERQALIDSVVRADKEHQTLHESSNESVENGERAETQFKAAQASLVQVNEKKKRADRLAVIRRADYDYYNDVLFLDQLGDRKLRIDMARKDAARAEHILANNRVNEKTLRTINQAERDLLTVNVRLETAAPNVTVRGLAACDIKIDDENTTLEADQVREMSVSDRLRITIPDHVVVEIAAGSSTDELTRQVAKAQKALDAACRAAGVDSPEAAHRAFEERREATRQLDEKGRIEQENLRDLSYDQLAEKLVQLEQTVPKYVVNRKHDSPIAADLVSAKTAWDEAETLQQETQTEWESAQNAVDAARDLRDELSKTHESVRIQLSSLKKDLQQQQTRLEAARKSASDESLEADWSEAKHAVDSEQAKVSEAEASLKAKRPDHVKTMSETAESSLRTTRKRRDAAQTELTRVQTRLKIHGEEGLHEKLQVACTHLETVTSNRNSLFRRAAAAKRLYDIMCQERDKARQAYVAPLKQRVQRLGRLVFDESFQVEIDDNLQIVNRTSAEITVPFDSLSGGTKEQLSLIFRLACSMIVAEEGGMPLIMDDALGYTDPDRLRLMGAVLARAAKECQIVIFTCVPDRYGNIGDASVVSI